MGCYFNPPDNLPNVGRRLNEGNFAELSAQLQPDEVLAGYLKRNGQPWENAVHLPDEREYSEFHRQQIEGHITLKGFFAVKKDVWNTKGGAPIR